MGERKLSESFRKIYDDVKEHIPFKTIYGVRIVDVWNEEYQIAAESKVGRVSNSLFTRFQAAKDKILLDKGIFKEVQWHFRVSPRTGKIGPTRALEENLLKKGIKIIKHFE